ncbi:hypothetical protein ACXVUM_13340 [Williamsia sp. SKLECPSW1]
MKQIERVRAGKRSSSEIRGSARPPHMQVMCSASERESHVPSLISLGPSTKAESMWLRVPGDPKSGSVTCYERAESPEHLYEIASRPGDCSVRVVTDASGAVVLTAFREDGRFRSRWSVNVGDEVNKYSIAERRRDAFWRRTIAPLTKLEDRTVDFMGLLLAPIVLLALLVPPNRLIISDAHGVGVGFIGIASSVIRPREDFSLYLDDQPYPLADHTLALAAIAVVQDLK